MATLTFVYAESVAVVGPLATTSEPHSWDLCERHAARITVPRGWEMLRSENGFARPGREEDDLTALAEAVREASGGAALPRMPELPGLIAAEVPVAEVPVSPLADTSREFPASAGSRPRSGRRGHLRVLPDPVE